MYILKHALKSISRSKGRNVLIGVIVLVIAISACLGLSIRQAAESAKQDALSDLSITATIAFDRQSMMQEMKEANAQSGGFDRSQFASRMGDFSSLTLEEYETYATAASVQHFYYTLTVSLNGTDTVSAVSTETSSSDSTTTASGSSATSTFPEGGNMGGKKGVSMENQGDFTLIGYSAESAMTAFQDGTASITDGVVFEEGTVDKTCIISEELATYNDLAVGDTITLANPNSETETYLLTIVGLYTTAASTDIGGPMGSMTATDPANQIYMSATALQSIVDASVSAATTSTDETTGRETSTAVVGSLSATYTFADSDAYEKFEEEARALGLSDSYTISSPDITAYENSLAPLNTLSKMAGYFLIVILLIGAIILVVLNIFNVRERKYEIGVLTAIGMKKGKVALQFLSEIFIVTIIPIIIGAGIGAASSVPVTNALLENQISSQQSAAEQVETNFGRGGMGDPGASIPDKGMEKGGFFGGDPTNYIAEIHSAMNLTVVWQLLLIGVLLTLASGAVSMLFVMRYEPLKILANRD